MQTEHPPPAPAANVRQPHIVLISIALVAGLAELAYAVMNVSAMPVYLKYSMHYGASSVAAIGTAFLLCEGLMKGPFGILGDRIGRKWLIMAGPTVSCVTALLTLLVQPHQWYFFVALRLLDGLGAAALWPSALVMMADVIEEERRSQAMSLFNVTYLVGIALGPFLGGVTNDITGALMPHTDPRRASFFLISALFLMTAAAAWWRVPNIPPHHHHSGELESGFDFRSLLRSLREIPETLVMSFITFLGIGLIMLIIKLFALDEFKLSESAFGALLLVPCLIIALASVPLGTLGDKIGKPRAIKLGLGICAFSMLSMSLLRTHLALVIGGSLIGIGFVISFPAWMAYVSENCRARERGAVMGAVGTAQGLGAMIGAPLGGYLYEHARTRIPGLPAELASRFAFFRVDSGAVYLNNHYAPFIGCALLLLTAWLLALHSIKDSRQHCAM